MGSHDSVEITIKCCNGKSINCHFRHDATGQQVFDLASTKFDIDQGAFFGVQLPSGNWLIKSKTLYKQLRKERKSGEFLLILT